MSAIRIDIGKDFSDVPSGRFPEDGNFNGERFRKQYLVPALRAGSKFIVNVDHTEGFGSSFLEEAFGGLIRLEGFRKAELDRLMEIEATKPQTLRYKRKIEQYLERADRSR